MPRERWRAARRWQDGRRYWLHGYQVSDRGRVRSVPRTLSDGRQHGGQMLAQHPDKDGYRRVRIGGRWYAVHVLVLWAFDGPAPEGTEGCHGPGGLADNRAEVLRWDTHSENLRDRERDKTRQPERLDWNGTHHPATNKTVCPRRDLVTLSEFASSHTERSLAAVRKASVRGGRFPRPAEHRGIVAFYDLAELRAWDQGIGPADG